MLLLESLELIAGMQGVRQNKQQESTGRMYTHSSSHLPRNPLSQMWKKQAFAHAQKHLFMCFRQSVAVNLFLRSASNFSL